MGGGTQDTPNTNRHNIGKTLKCQPKSGQSAARGQNRDIPFIGTPRRRARDIPCRDGSGFFWKEIGILLCGFSQQEQDQGFKAKIKIISIGPEGLGHAGGDEKGRSLASPRSSPEVGTQRLRGRAQLPTLHFGDFQEKPEKTQHFPTPVRPGHPRGGGGSGQAWKHLAVAASLRKVRRNYRNGSEC